MKKTALLSATMLCCFIALAQSTRYSFKETFELNNPKKLEITANHSNIEIATHPENTIEVYYIVEQNNQLVHTSKEELLQTAKKQWKLITEAAKNKLTLTVIDTKNNKALVQENTLNIHFKVYVPKSMQTKISSATGSIILKGLNNKQYCHTNQGNIHLENVRGKVIAVTYNGNITMDNVTALVDCHVMGNKAAYATTY